MSPAEARIELWRARTGPKRHCRGKSAYRLNNFPGLPDCHRSEEHTSELQSLMRISYAVFCLKKKKTTNTIIMTSDPPTQEKYSTSIYTITYKQYHCTDCNHKTMITSYQDN